MLCRSIRTLKPSGERVAFVCMMRSIERLVVAFLIIRCENTGLDRTDVCTQGKSRNYAGKLLARGTWTSAPSFFCDPQLAYSPQPCVIGATYAVNLTHVPTHIPHSRGITATRAIVSDIAAVTMVLAVYCCGSTRLPFVEPSTHHNTEMR